MSHILSGLLAIPVRYSAPFAVALRHMHMHTSMLVAWQYDMSVRACCQAGFNTFLVAVACGQTTWLACGHGFVSFVRLTGLCPVCGDL